MITPEMLEAVASELRLFKFVLQHEPTMPINRIHDCGCVGPLPECRCMKRDRLIREFLEIMKEPTNG